MSKARLEAFSDGVLAIAVTLLALALPTPAAGYKHSLAHYLAANWPSYAAYLSSFLIIGIIWINHHALFVTVTVVTRWAVLANLFLLLCVVSIPYATSLLAQYLRSGGWDAKVAAAIYSGVALGMAVGFTVLFELLGRAAMAADPSLSRAAHVAGLRRFSAGVIPYVVSVGVSFISAPATLALQFALAGYYLFDQLGGGPGGVGAAAPADTS